MFFIIENIQRWSNSYILDDKTEIINYIAEFT